MGFGFIETFAEIADTDARVNSHHDRGSQVAWYIYMCN